MDSKMLAIIGALMLAATGVYMTLNGNQDITSGFEAFKARHGKVYSSQSEEAYRFAIYNQNIDMINKHNADKTQTYTMAENHMADLTKDEFRAMYLGYKPHNRVVEAKEESYIGSVNWVTAGKVQRVKDQGQCGSCWAFSTVASCESLEAVHYDSSPGDYSEQQLVDCSGSYGNNGCNGGLMDFGFQYFADKFICTEESYGYTAKDGTCQLNSGGSGCLPASLKIGGYTDVNGVSGLKAACDKQPVSIAVDAQNWSFYSGGVFSDCGTSLDHGVLLAGYSDDDWLVKNSWGEGWGEAGYIRLASGNTCGLANQPSYPKVKE